MPIYWLAGLSGCGSLACTYSLAGLLAFLVARVFVCSTPYTLRACSLACSLARSLVLFRLLKPSVATRFRAWHGGASQRMAPCIILPSMILPYVMLLYLTLCYRMLWYGMVWYGMLMLRCIEFGYVRTVPHRTTPHRTPYDLTCSGRLSRLILRCPMLPDILFSSLILPHLFAPALTASYLLQDPIILHFIIEHPCILSHLISFHVLFISSRIISHYLIRMI